MEHQLRRVSAGLLALFVLSCAATEVQASMAVSLGSSIPSPAPVGSLVTWTPTVSGAAPGTLWYRYRVSPLGGDFRIVRDFGPVDTLDWTASEQEGSYLIELSVRNRDTGESATASALFQMISRVTGGNPVITQTFHPLVFMYSAPPCPAGSWMSVNFQSPGTYIRTQPKPCSGSQSMNFYLAGMRPGTTYWVQHAIDGGSGAQTVGPVLTLTTPAAPPFQLPSFRVIQPPPATAQDDILLQSSLSNGIFATDLYGNLVWYYPWSLSALTRPVPGGYFYGFVQNFGQDPSQQLVRKFDLTGLTLRETNAARVNEQLAVMGKRQINAFHHEATELLDGRVLVLANTEQLLTNVQGSGTADVLGDMILVLDQDLQVLWAWDAFDYLDPHRAATLGETCSGAGSGCPPYYLAPQANDWLHGNSLQFTPDGNILYSVRHQDWLVKIDFNNGQGTGAIIWRLGKDGDFRVNSADPDPWFSHQHDAQYEAGDPSTLTVFDDGNLRYAADPTAHSRGQAWQLDEQGLVATPVLNADLGGYALALGSAQTLLDGNYHFDLGWLPDNSTQALEVDPVGNIVYALRVGAQEYRSFRMKDLYSAYEAQPTLAQRR
jgi:arylsulfate sulfotransferase